MATTTTNFGWDIPQSTDLVKDGATAIAALGQDIDTALVDLKGGTTGQVLAKASGTDLDFSWVAQDDSNAIQNAIVDAKGDLIAATAADTPARLAVGTNGYVLTADSAESTGLKWAAASAGKILQVVQGTTTTSTTITTSTMTDTTITASITPTSSTSKILVIVDAQAYIYRGSTSTFNGWALLRGTTKIYDRENEGFMCITAVGASAVELVGNSPMTYLDSPATGSSTTYKVQAKSISGGSITFQRNSVPSSITLIEVAP
jgi:hypothetical protein